MAKIARYNGNFKAFAADASAGKRYVFGSDSTASDALTDNMNADFFAGWETIGSSGVPPKQWFNAVGFAATQAAAYLHQMGIAEYDAAQEYPENALTNRSGVVYRSLADGNIGNTPESSPLSWEPTTSQTALTAPVTVTVGAAGDYLTLNAALAAVVAQYMPVYVSGGNPSVTINLLTGFVMAEQVVINGLDLSWITITGDDATTTITRSALTDAVFGAVFPAFGVINNGKGPRIQQAFTMDTSGTATNRCHVFVGDGGSIVCQSTMDSAPYGAYIVAGFLYGGSFPSSINVGIFCEASGTYFDRYASTDVSGSGTGILADNGSVVVVSSGCDASGCTVAGIKAMSGSKISFEGGNAQKGGSPATTDIVCERGSIIQANGATGGVSQTVNTITSDGIIFG